MTILDLAALLALLSPAGKADFYIGTYTTRNGSQGIYRAQLNERDGSISTPELAVKSPNPSFVAVHPGGKWVYAIDEANRGTVSAFRRLSNGDLALLNTQSTGGSGPCFVSVDLSGHDVFVANYGSGSLESLRVLRDGSVSLPSTFFQDSGTGPVADRQEGPHVHCIVADPQDRFAYSCDLGTDEVLVFNLDPKSAKLAPHDPRSIHVAPGSGPRHLAFSPNGRFAYVVDELASTVIAFRRDTRTGDMTQIQTLSARGPEHAKKPSYSAELLFHPSGKWLYATNRGDDTVAVFDLSPHGRLKLIQVEPAGVKFPRGAGIDPTGRWLLVAGQNSDDVTSLSIDPDTGKLTATNHVIPIRSPVSIAFVP